MDEKPVIWFTKVFGKARLPTWLGLLFFGLLPYFAIGVAGDSIVGAVSHRNLLAGVGALLPLTIAIVLIPLCGSVYISRTMEDVEVYTMTLLKSGDLTSRSSKPVNFRLLYSVRVVVSLTAVFFILVTAAYVISVATSNYLPYFALSPAWIYAFFVDMTFVWTYCYSMYSVWRIGHLPLAVPPFTEDRTLGLQPFGSASLRLTAIFLTLATIDLVSVHIFATSVPILEISLVLVIFAFTGLALFFLSLFGLHEKLVTMKRKEMKWISTEHTAVLKEIRESGGFGDEKLTRRLASVKSVREDVTRIRSWPLDTEMIARLVTVVVFPLVIAIAVPFLLSTLHF